MEIIILGDSHTTPLAMGLEMLRHEPGFDASLDIKAAVFQGSPALVERFFEEQPDKVTPNDDGSRRALRSLIGTECFGRDDRSKVFALSMGFPPQLLLSYADWNDFAPWTQSDTGRQLLSTAVVAALALDHFKHVLAFYRALRKLGLACIAVASPPLLPGGQWFAPDLEPKIVLAVTNILRQAVADELATYGVPTVFPPKRVHVDDDRALHRRPEFPSFKGPHDKGHADGKFGRLMVRRIIAMARTLKEAEPAPV